MRSLLNLGIDLFRIRGRATPNRFHQVGGLLNAVLTRISISPALSGRQLMSLRFDVRGSLVTHCPHNRRLDIAWVSN